MTTAIRGTLTEIVASAVEAADDDLATLCGGTPAFLAVLDALEGGAGSLNVRVLATDSAVRDVKRDHVTAARFADQVASGSATVRVLADDRLPETVLIAEDFVVAALTGLPEVAVGVPTEDDEVVDACRRGFTTLWEETNDYDPESLTYSELLGSVQEEFGDEMAADLEVAVKTPGVRGLRDNLDLVDLLVLLAARHRHQLYELTQWGSDAGVASVGTFSQAKRRLEDIGLVGTETVHSGDVGRPRQRLVLAQEDLHEASVEDLVAAAQSVLVN